MLLLGVSLLGVGFGIGGECWVWVLGVDVGCGC